MKWRGGAPQAKVGLPASFKIGRWGGGGGGGRHHILSFCYLINRD